MVLFKAKADCCLLGSDLEMIAAIATAMQAFGAAEFEES
jgi:hypothetical protein